MKVRVPQQVVGNGDGRTLAAPLRGKNDDGHRQGADPAPVRNQPEVAGPTGGGIEVDAGTEVGIVVVVEALRGRGE